MAITNVNNDNIRSILDETWSWSKTQGLKGYNKHDGLNSPFLHFTLGWSKWARIIAIQSVMRSPINLRPFLHVKKSYNPKGLALFILGLLDRYKTESKEDYLSEAEKLYDLLKQTSSRGGWSGICWGYQYPWQDLGFYAKTATPNAVVTCFVCEALLELYRLTGKTRYIDDVKSAINFFLNDLTVLKDTEDELCLAYMPMKMNMRVMDVSILIAAVIAQYNKIKDHVNDDGVAEKLARYVVNQQTDYHAWFYTDPPDDCLIRHDNYHTGFILDALWRYMEASSDWQWKSYYEKGLQFYANELFTKDGAPKWMSDKEYPYDIHGSAQGIITFSNASVNGYKFSNLPEKLTKWAIANMYGNNGQFYYQKTRYFTKKFTLLRWCNGWMFRALSCFNSISEK